MPLRGSLFLVFPLALLLSVSLGTFIAGASPGAAPAENVRWESIGPEGGIVSTLAIDPVDTSVLYAGTQQGGVFKSLDGGASWRPVNNGLGNLVVYSVAVDPTSPNIVYAATEGGDLFQSTDGGYRWSVSFKGHWPFATASVTVDPVTPHTAYFAVDGAYAAVFKTTDDGASWDVVFGYSAAAVAVDPTTPSTIYVAANDFSRVFKSVDGGKTWSSGGDLYSRIHGLGIDPTKPSRIFAGTDAGIYRSVDAGLTWTAVNDGIGSIFCSAVAVNPLASSSLYAACGKGAGDGGAFRSSDGGDTWSRMSLPPQGVSHSLSMIINPSSPSTIYAGMLGGGVLRSTDRGDHWLATNRGLTATAVHSMAIDPSDNRVIYVGTKTNDVFRSDDEGRTWSAFALPGSDGAAWIEAVAVDPTSPNTVYAGTWGGGVYKSVDHGRTWALAFRAFYPVNSFAFDPTSSWTYAGAQEGVYRSIDRGLNWSFAGQGLPDVFGVVVARQQGGALYCGSDDGVFKSIDHGMHWSRSGMDGYFVDNIAVDVGNNAILAGAENGVFRSDGSGLVWTSSQHFAPSLMMPEPTDTSALVVDPFNPRFVYAGFRDQAAGDHLLKSSSYGVSWTDFSLGLPKGNIRIHALVTTDPERSDPPAWVYVGLEGGGVFRIRSTAANPSPPPGRPMPRVVAPRPPASDASAGDGN